MKLEDKLQIKPKVSKLKPKAKMAQIKYTENRKTKKCSFFENVNKIDKPLARLIRTKRI